MRFWHWVIFWPNGNEDPIAVAGRVLQVLVSLACYSSSVAKTIPCGGLGPDTGRCYTPVRTGSLVLRVLGEILILRTVELGGCH